jgi:predicted tellurium resistance membrane protein TerC
MMELLTFENIVALLTLTMLEIVLGIDNIVFLVILTGKLDPAKQVRARRLGLFAAMFMRILLLLTITWIMRLTRPLFEVFGHGFSGRDLILLAGGLFLIGKSTYEIHHNLEPEGKLLSPARMVSSFSRVILQVMLIDIVFSLDSVITAVGMARHVMIMIVAVVAAVVTMFVFLETVTNFIEQHPTFKMLALSFLLLVGVVLVADGLGKHISKGYIYFAMAFSLLVEILNIRVRGRGRPSSDLYPGRQKLPADG